MKNSEKAPPKTPLAKRLRKARRDAGYETINDFVNKNGFELSAYTLHELGHRSPKLPTLKKYASILGVSWQYLHDGTDAPQMPDEFELVNSYDVTAAAGHGGDLSAENIKHKVSFRSDWLRQITSAPLSKLAVISVSGDSMEPTLKGGDTVLIDCNQCNPKNDGIYFIRYDGDGLIKRIQYNPKEKTVKIISDNPLYDAIDASPNDFVVIGRAVWTGRKL